MAEIDVTPAGENQFEVTVKSASTTTHQVTVPNDYYQRLTQGGISLEELVRRSFAFLLERESNTMILARFELPLINRYFPDYERHIKQNL